VLRTAVPPGSLSDLLLTAGMRVLWGEVAAIDGLLDDERFFGLFRELFDPLRDGRRSRSKRICGRCSEIPLWTWV
jgi:hypothetical protein